MTKKRKIFTSLQYFSAFFFYILYFFKNKLELKEEDEIPLCITLDGMLSLERKVNMTFRSFLVIKCALGLF